jgi:membrane protein CcdC involved in cytochrome C biogenesis
MSPSDTQLYLPLVIALAFFVLMGRRMMRPRRFRVGSLLIGPIMTLVGIAAYFTTHTEPSIGHVAGLTAALVIGGVLGWGRAKLTRIEIDKETGILTQRGTPYGMLLLVGLLIVRSGIRIVDMKHPEYGIDLNRATDVLLFFALGIVTGYAGELCIAVRRARRDA